MWYKMSYLGAALALGLTLSLTANAQDEATAEDQTQDTTAQAEAAAPDAPRPMGRGQGGQGYGRGFRQGPFFEDEDEDGICDNYDPEAADQPGIGRGQGGPGYGRVWMDDDAENAAPMGRGPGGRGAAPRRIAPESEESEPRMGRGQGGPGYGSGFCQGPFFEDEDDDGICDNYDPEAADEPGIGRGQGGPGYGRVWMDEDAENAAPMGWQGRGPRGAASRQQQAGPPRQMRPRAGQR